MKTFRKNIGFLRISKKINYLKVSIRSCEFLNILFVDSLHGLLLIGGVVLVGCCVLECVYARVYVCACVFVLFCVRHVCVVFGYVSVRA